MSQPPREFGGARCGRPQPVRDRPRGLVHAAMGFHYVTAGDTVSARSKLSSATTLLEGFAGDFLGLDVDGLRAGIAGVHAVLATAGDAPGDPRRVVIPRLAGPPGDPAVCETQP